MSELFRNMNEWYWDASRGMGMSDAGTRMYGWYRNKNDWYGDERRRTWMSDAGTRMCGWYRNKNEWYGDERRGMGMICPGFGGLRNGSQSLYICGGQRI